MSTNNWMDFALDDLDGGEILFRESKFNMASFHAQQAAEKALKGLKALFYKHGDGIVIPYFFIGIDCMNFGHIPYNGNYAQFQKVLGFGRRATSCDHVSSTLS